jgi:hypothetical protein
VSALFNARLRSRDPILTHSDLRLSDRTSHEPRLCDGEWPRATGAPLGPARPLNGIRRTKLTNQARDCRRSLLNCHGYLSEQQIQGSLAGSTLLETASLLPERRLRRFPITGRSQPLGLRPNPLRFPSFKRELGPVAKKCRIFRTDGLTSFSRGSRVKMRSGPAREIGGNPNFPCGDPSESERMGGGAAA